MFAEKTAFARGVSFHKLVFVFTAGCVIGYIAEMVFCVFRHGYIQTRQGMIVGPFSQIYGIAAVAMTMFLEPLRKKGPAPVFILSGVIGSAVELLASYAQEFIFHSRSWDFSDQTFSIEGRTSLMFMGFWCVLGFAYIWWIYPRVSRLIERIPRQIGPVISWALVVFFAVNLALSAAAVLRWNERRRDIPAQYAADRVLDEAFPDEKMEELYPQIEFVD